MALINNLGILTINTALLQGGGGSCTRAQNPAGFDDGRRWRTHRNNKINSTIYEVVEGVMGPPEQIEFAPEANRWINRANIIHSTFPSRRQGKNCFRLKTCRTPVPVMEGMRG